MRGKRRFCLFSHGNTLICIYVSLRAGRVRLHAILTVTVGGGGGPTYRVLFLCGREVGCGTFTDIEIEREKKLNNEAEKCSL